MVEETAARRRQAFSDENLYLEPVLAPLLRRVEVPPSCRLPEGVTVTLERAQLWKAFYARTNEMIVTRKGRKMFPTIRLRVSGLEKTSLYAMCLEFVQVHDIKFRYIHGDWKQTATARADPPPTAVYVHPKSYQMGTFWMSETISFDDVKITNDKTVGPSMMPLNSMHMYEPRLHMVRVNVIPGQGLEAVSVMSHRLRVTGFVAVTAYQNDKVTALKVENNPFARAFNRSASALAAFEMSLAHAGQMLNNSQQQQQLQQEHHQQQQQQQLQQQQQQQQQQHNTEQAAHAAQSRYQPYMARLPPGGAPSQRRLIGRYRVPAAEGSPGEDGDRPFYPEEQFAAHQHSDFAGQPLPPNSSAPFTPYSGAPEGPVQCRRPPAASPVGPPPPRGYPTQQLGPALPYQQQWPPTTCCPADGYRAAVGTPSPASSSGWGDASATGGNNGNYWCGDSPPNEWGDGAGCAAGRLAGGRQVKIEPACLLTPPHGSPAAGAAARAPPPPCSVPSWPGATQSPHCSPPLAQPPRLPVDENRGWQTPAPTPASCGQTWAAPTPVPVPAGSGGWPGCPPLTPALDLAAGGAQLGPEFAECSMVAGAGFFVPASGPPPTDGSVSHQ